MATSERRSTGGPRCHSDRWTVPKESSDVHREATRPKGALCRRRVREGAGDVSSKVDEHAGPAVREGFKGTHNVGTRRARCIEPERGREPIEKHWLRCAPYAHRAVALHVGMATDGAQPCAGPTDAPRQQREVHDVADGGDRVTVLRHAHGPTDGDSLRRSDEFPRGLQKLQGNADLRRGRRGRRGHAGVQRRRRGSHRCGHR